MDINLSPDIAEEKQTATRTAKRSQFNYLIKTYPSIYRCFMDSLITVVLSYYVGRVMEFDMQLK
jgi:hypothetical protein